MALKVGELFSEIGLDESRFSRGIDQSESRLRGFAGRIGPIVATGVAAGAAALTGLAIKGLQEFASFEAGMNEVMTLLPDVSADFASEFTDDIREVGAELGRLPEDVIPSVYNSLSAGIPSGNVIEFLADADELAVAGVSTLDESVNLLTGTINAYGLEASDAGEISDVFFATVRAGKTTLPELGASLGQVLPTAATFGVSLEDVGASMATLTKIMGNTPQAATGLRSVLAELGKDGTEAFGVFEDAAGVTFPEFMAEGGDMAEVIQILSDAADESGVTILDLFSSIEAGSAAAALATDEGSLLIENLDAMGDAAGGTEEAFETMDQGLSRSWDKIKASATAALISMAAELAPFVQQALDWLAVRLPGAIQTLMTWFQNAAAVIGPIVQGLGNVIGPVFETITGWIQGFRDAAGDSTSDVSGFLADLSDFFSETMEQIEGIVSTAIEAIQIFWDRWGADILGTAMRVFGEIQNVISGVLDVIRGIFEVFAGIFSGDFDRMLSGLRTMWDGTWKALGGILRGARDILVLALRMLRDMLLGIWRGLVSKLQTAWADFSSWLGGKVSDIASNTVDGIRGMRDDLVDFIKGIPGMVLDAIGDLGSLLWDAGRSIIQGLIDGVTSMISSLREKLNSVTGWIPDWKGPPAEDRRLLMESGSLIMEGLISGISGQEDSLRRALQSIGGGISGSFGSGFTGGAFGSGSGLSPALAGAPVVTQIYLDGRMIEERISKRQVDRYYLDTGRIL